MNESIGFIGAGKVGVTLAKFFKDKGLNVKFIVARSRASFERATKYIKTVKIIRELEEIPKTDVIFVTVNDDAIKAVSHKVRRITGEETIIIHTSGFHPSSLIPGKNASFHPLFSFADMEKAYSSLQNILFAIEGSEEGKNFLKKLCQKLNLKYTEIHTKSKPLYHIAAVIASNYLVTLMHHAIAALKASGATSNEALKGLITLSKGTLENIIIKGTPDALTGPIARRDIETIEKHLEALENYRDLKEFYKVMGLFTTKMLKKDKKLTIIEEKLRN